MDANRLQRIINNGNRSFNPRARDGREAGTIASLSVYKVSIHAPVMDANRAAINCAMSDYVSIHAPVMDANIAVRDALNL